jgi:putative hydrolase of the HAD superfamily
MTSRPQVIFLDAVGTLFDVRGSVGEIYSRQAAQFEVSVEPAQLTQAFYRAFQDAPPMAFPGATPEAVPDLEYRWWRELVRHSFEAAGVLSALGHNFEAFFEQLYNYFRKAEAWQVYPDAWVALRYWQDQQIALGVISDFDSRLHDVLQALDLRQFFDSVTISTEVGAAKPNSLLFETALAKHHCPPDAAWHIGDSYSGDIVGAQQAGLQAIWIRREPN